jgi:hypothetical protein
MPEHTAAIAAAAPARFHRQNAFIDSGTPECPSDEALRDAQRQGRDVAGVIGASQAVRSAALVVSDDQRGVTSNVTGSILSEWRPAKFRELLLRLPVNGANGVAGGGWEIRLNSALAFAESRRERGLRLN